MLLGYFEDRDFYTERTSNIHNTQSSPKSLLEAPSPIIQNNQSSLF